MQPKAKTANTIIHVMDGNYYEVLNSMDEIKSIMFDDFINPDTFIRLMFPDGIALYVRKGSVIAFYISED